MDIKYMIDPTESQKIILEWLSSDEYKKLLENTSCNQSQDFKMGAMWGATMVGVLLATKPTRYGVKENTAIKAGKYVNIDQLWKCETCFYNQHKGCTAGWCENGESYIPSIHKLQLEEIKSMSELADEVEDKMMYMCGCLNCITKIRMIIEGNVVPFDSKCDSCRNKTCHDKIKSK